MEKLQDAETGNVEEVENCPRVEPVGCEVGLVAVEDYDDELTSRPPMTLFREGVGTSASVGEWCLRLLDRGIRVVSVGPISVIPGDVADKPGIVIPRNARQRTKALESGQFTVLGDDFLDDRVDSRCRNLKPRPHRLAEERGCGPNLVEIRMA